MTLLTLYRIFVVLILLEGWIVGTWSLVTGAIEDSNDGLTWAIIDGIAWSVMSLIFAPFYIVWGWICTPFFFIKD